MAVLLTCLSVVTLASAAGAQDECPILDPDCATTTTSTPVDPTSTTVEDTTTTVEEITTTTERSTATTRDQPATTEEEVVVTTTEAPVTTSSNLLIAGDGTAGAESTTTTATPVASVRDSGLSDGTLIALMIAGLVAVAALVGVLTWRYWAATRPPRAPRPAAEPRGSSTSPTTSRSASVFRDP